MLVRDVAITDAHKFNLQEAIHAIKAAFKNLPEQEKHAITDVLIESLNTNHGKFYKELNSKHLKLTKHIASGES